MIKLRTISLGAGVQSTTMALMAARGEAGPMPDCAIFADTGWEPRRVYEHLDRQVDAAIRSSDYREGVAKVRAQQFMHRSCVPLGQVDLRTDAEVGQDDLFDHECQGMCGT